MPQDYIYTGFWIKHDGSAKGGIITLTNIWATVVLGALGLLLTIAQSRSWIITRNIFRRSRGIHLEDSLDDISQWSALKIGWSHIRSSPMLQACFGRKQIHEDRERPDYRTSPWIGLLAVFSVILFGCLGIFLSWLLTHGWEGTPEVRSKQTDACRDIWDKSASQNVSSILSDVVLAESAWATCSGREETISYCDQNFDGLKQYSTSIEARCPFASGICIDNHPIVSFTRTNLTPHDLGINSRLKLAVSHRLTCSAISTTPFIYSGPETYKGSFLFSIQNPELVDNNTAEFNETLLSNMWTDNHFGSGREMLDRGHSFVFEVLPRSVPGSSTNQQSIHPLLKRSDGKTFAFVLKAGAIMYHDNAPITDPLFSATGAWDTALPPGEKPVYFVPDKETAVLGCIEQFQVCFETESGLKCYPWMKGITGYTNSMARDLLNKFGDKLAFDYFAIFDRLLELETSSILSFLQKTTRLGRPMLMAPMVIAPGTPQIAEIDGTRQWTRELEVLLAKATIWQNMCIKDIVQNLDSHENSTLLSSGSGNLTLMKLCDRILFTNGDYTNIDVMWTAISMGTMVILCIFSHPAIHVPCVDKIFDWSGSLKSSGRVVAGVARALWDALRQRRSPWIRWMTKPRPVGTNLRMNAILTGRTQPNDQEEVDDPIPGP